LVNRTLVLVFQAKASAFGMVWVVLPSHHRTEFAAKAWLASTACRVIPTVLESSVRTRRQGQAFTDDPTVILTVAYGVKIPAQALVLRAPAEARVFGLAGIQQDTSMETLKLLATLMRQVETLNSA
jgi:hypothetical protein